jgi:methionyl-tRNA synthetase
MREMPTGADASYTPERFLARYGELANVLGNLASRATSMIHKYRGGTVPESAGGGLDAEIRSTFETYRGSMEALRIHDALESAMGLARAANVYVETQEPWALAKDEAKAGALDDVLATLARTLIVLASLFEPVMPRKMAELSRAMGLEETPDFRRALETRPAGLRVEKLAPLFPRRDEA